MKYYKIILQPSAVDDLDNIRKYETSMILDEIETHLVYRPDIESKSRIKKLRGKQTTDYRLKVDDYRIFYNINKSKKIVYILRIMHKNQTKEFYKEEL